jgi:hypothetical protein
MATYEEKYGVEKAKEIKSKMSRAFQDKTYEQRFGKKKAKEIKDKISKASSSHKGWKHKEETKIKISNALKGITFEQRFGKEEADKIKAKIGEKSSMGLRGHLVSEETKRKISQANKGKKHTDETKRLMSKAKLGIKKPQTSITLKNRWKDPAFYKHIKIDCGFRHLGKHSQETKEKMRLVKIGIPRSEETKKKLSLACIGRPSSMKGKHHTIETKKILSEISKKLWKDENFLKKVHENYNRKPSKFELLVLKKLQQIFPNEWKYTGDGSVWITIEGKHYNPDFMNINGKKIIIEFNGFYTHNKQQDDLRQKAFEKIGYRTIFIYPKDLGDEIFVKKIGEFL